MKTAIRNTLAAACLLALAGTAQAQISGYVTHTHAAYVKSTSTLCVRTGYWTPALAVPACDPGPAIKPAARVEPKLLPQAAVEPPPAPPAVPALVPAGPPVTKAPQAALKPAERAVISGEVLFDFDRALLKEEARAKLDSLADQLKFIQLEVIMATGHADRIGSDAYNQRLSERRAAAVKAYLVAKGIDAERVDAQGRGESEPLTGDKCGNMGRENRNNQKLIACLQPDRRVGVEAQGTRAQLSSR